MRAGAQDYLVKGEIQVDLLIRTIRHAIDRHRLVAALRDSVGKQVLVGGRAQSAQED